MNALLIISHGSRRAASNDEVLALAQQVQTGAPSLAVACAFLEMAEPKIETAIADLVRAGATEICVFPHFLAAGTHVSQDIPRALDAARTRYPELTIQLLPHLGALTALPSLIVDLLAPREHTSPRAPL